MRPNIDIPWSVHGQVKDYAEDTDASLDEAYSELIQEGLDEAGESREGDQ